MSPGCALWLPLAVRDLFAEVRNLVGVVGSRFFTAGRRDWQPNSCADGRPDQKSTYFTQYLGIFFAAKSIAGAAQTSRAAFLYFPFTQIL